MSVDVDDKKVQLLLDKLYSFATQPPAKLFKLIGDYSVFSIESRTAQGKDVKGQAFKGYSESYKKVREKAGRPINKVDLFFTGKMLGSMTHRKQGTDKVQIYFSMQEQATKAAHLTEKRNFFALSLSDHQKIKNIIIKTLEEVTR